MKYPLILTLFLCCAFAQAQQNESFYVFDANWKPTKMDSAQFMLHIYQMNDTCWHWDYYHYIGPLVKTEQYVDKDGNDLNGVSNYYNEHGDIDSTTMFRHGKKNGDSWRFSGDSLKHKVKYVYQDDSLLEIVDMTNQKMDSIKYSDEKESVFPGGMKAWAAFINKNIRYPDRAMHAEIKGNLLVDFIIDQEGNIIDSYIARSVEYSLDWEALRIIRSSGKWQPAFQNGHTVKSYKRHPIYFVLE